MMYEILFRDQNKSVVTSKWIYMIKHAADESVEKYKARFVARGCSKAEGVYLDETFDPVAQYTSIRTIIHELETTSDGCKDNLSQW